MTQLGGNTSATLKKIRGKIKTQLIKRDIEVIDANSRITGGDILTKIWRQILEVPIGVAIITSDMSTSTIANIFYEIGLLDSLGKESIVVKGNSCKIPSDFIRTEYVLHDKDFSKNFNKFLDTTFEQAEYYEQMSELLDADPVLSIDYLRRAYLITGDKNLIKKAKKIYKQNEFDNQPRFTIQNFLGS
ncbi:MAG: hypothetical protein HQ530_03700 [Parcubacteria group bacterium]|nr:hypothetical protein [Parcubacteria group bacterium]